MEISYRLFVSKVRANTLLFKIRNLVNSFKGTLMQI